MRHDTFFKINAPGEEPVVKSLVEVVKDGSDMFRPVDAGEDRRKGYQAFQTPDTI